MVEAGIDGISEVDAYLLCAIAYQHELLRWGREIGAYIYVTGLVGELRRSGYCGSGSHGEGADCGRTAEESIKDAWELRVVGKAIHGVCAGVVLSWILRLGGFGVEGEA